eukprot:gene3993-26883_t
MNAQQVLAEKEYVDAFNGCKGVLGAFASCENASDLGLVKDGFMLCMGGALCLDLYAPVKAAIVADEKVADAAGKLNAFQVQVLAARGADGWPALVAAVEAKAVAVGSDLAGIWGGLVRGRLEWIMARNATHMLKIHLKRALIDGSGAEGDEMDAKMIWVYSLGLVLNSCKEHAVVWADKACITVPEQPLKGFDPAKWDVRLPEWQTLDAGVGEAAERAGTTLEKEWDLIGTQIDPTAVEEEID